MISLIKSLEKFETLFIIRKRISEMILFYRKYGTIIRFTLILLVALWINFYILSDIKIPSNDLERVTESNVTYINLKGYFDLKEEDLNSGNFNAILWKMIYLGGGKDKICFDRDSYSNMSQFFANYSGGYYNITKKQCFSIPKDKENLTFQVSYSFSLTLPNNMRSFSNRVVNKSECVQITDDHTCVTQEGIDNAQTFVFQPNGKVYLEANLFHKLIKFIFIFFSVGAIIWGFSRTIYLIRYGWEKRIETKN